ncbi:MAG: hypothetical protein LBJ12_08945 [Oscillospiraceae bacterium]|nr:hypothetical protein [Oscillospiraceae bacterium]
MESCNHIPKRRDFLHKPLSSASVPSLGKNGELKRPLSFDERSKAQLDAEPQKGYDKYLGAAEEYGI